MDRIDELEARLARLEDLSAVLSTGLCAALAQLRESRTLCPINWRFDVEQIISVLPADKVSRCTDMTASLCRVMNNISESRRPGEGRTS
jgi:hypothetical protein